MPKALAHTIGVKEFSWGSLGAPVGPGQGLDRGSGDKGSRSSTYLTFANILRRCKINQFLFTNVRYTNQMIIWKALYLYWKLSTSSTSQDLDQKEMIVFPHNLSRETFISMHFVLLLKNPKHITFLQPLNQSALQIVLSF